MKMNRKRKRNEEIIEKSMQKILPHFGGIPVFVRLKWKSSNCN